MKEILSQILDELKIHTRELQAQTELMKTNTFGYDETATERINAIKKIVLSNPFVSSNPQAKQMIESVFDIKREVKK
jgi:hypothetical protein